MAVQDDLRGKGWVSADLDRDVSPLAVQNMEGEMVDIGVRLLAPDMSVVKDFEDRCLRSTYKDQKQAFLNVRCPQVLIAISCLCSPFLHRRTGILFA
jgi:hypothetical protein